MVKKILNKKIIVILAFASLLLFCVYMLVHRNWFSPDQFFVFALFGAFIIGRTRMFLFDWIPFILIYFSYELLRGIVPYINKNVHIFGMIKIDQFIFGYIPAVKFQSLLYNPANLHWYDYASAFVYISHFVTPMIIGFLFWLTDRKTFKKFSIALLVLSYAALITFIIFPAMPPWMASDMGYIPEKIPQTLGPIMSHFPPTATSFPTIYQFVASDLVAAVPSLHAAFPLLILFYLIKKYKKMGLIFLPYVGAVWFSVMYLGEHYFADILVGAIYAVVVFIVIERLKRPSLPLATT